MFNYGPSISSTTAAFHTKKILLINSLIFLLKTIGVFRLKRTELRGNNNEKGYDLEAPDMKSLENGKKWIGTSGMKS